MNDNCDAEFTGLTAQVMALSRRIDALQAELNGFARIAVRFGRDIELRERGWS